MTISHVGSTTGGLPSGGANTCNVPAGVVAGDYMITTISCGSTNTLTPPSGWTLIGSILDSNAPWQFWYYGRVATAGEPALYTWTSGTVVNIVCSAFHSTNGAMSLGPTSNAANLSFNFINIPGITAPSAGSLVTVGTYNTATGGTINTWVAPSGFTQLVDFRGNSISDIGVAFKASQSAGATGTVTVSWTGNSQGNAAALIMLLEPITLVPQYYKSSTITPVDFNAYAGFTNVSAGSSSNAAAIAGYLWGVGYGDRGYGETTQAITTTMAKGSLVGNEWNKLQTILQSMTTWQNLSSSLYPPSSVMGTGKAVEAHNTSAPTSDAYGVPTLLSTLDSSRLSVNAAFMTLTAAGATTTRASTWGAGAGGITCEFTVTFASEDAARYFFNTGCEVRISLSHPTTGTARDNSWNTVLNGFVASFKANTTTRTGGGYGGSTGIGYYALTTAYQTIIDGTNTGISVYGSNDFYVEAKASTITGLNGAKGSVLNFRVRLIDEQTNAFSDIVSSGTVANVGHLRGTSGPLTAKAAPTCSVLTAF